MKAAVIIPAAGMGKRFGAALSGRTKIEVDLGGRPMFLRTIEIFLNRPQVQQIILAVNPDRLDQFKFKWGDRLGFGGVSVVAGGREERWETVLKAMEAVDGSCTHVAVHDAARPLASKALIDRVFEAAERFAAVVPGIAVNATLKRIGEPGDTDSKKRVDPLDAILEDAPNTTLKTVVETVDRSDLVEAQTPQVFEISLFRRAYAQIHKGGVNRKDVTDDAMLVEMLGESVRVVEGESTNLKITREEDLTLAQAIVEQRDQQKAAALGSKRLFRDEDD